MKSLTDTEFKGAIAQQDRLVVVKFTATWCGPCKAYAPIAEAVATSLKDLAHFYEVNIDDCLEATVDANVMVVPTTVVYKGGVEVERKTGVVKDLEQWIQQKK